MSLPESSRAIVFDPSDRSLSLRHLPMRPLRPGEVLARVRLSAICGSDLHTIRGRRDPGGPLVLGHEIVGEVAARDQAHARPRPRERRAGRLPRSAPLRR